MASTKKSLALPPWTFYGALGTVITIVLLAVVRTIATAPTSPRSWLGLVWIVLAVLAFTCAVGDKQQYGRRGRHEATDE